jgi:hypothetical protein
MAQYWSEIASGKYPYRGTNSFTLVSGVDDSPPVLLAAANNERLSVTFQNVGANEVYIGRASNMTTALGILLAAGAIYTDNFSADVWYGICSSGESTNVMVVTVT